MKAYKVVIREMMREYKIPMKTALEWDTFGVQNLETYFKNYKLDNTQINHYMDILKGETA